MPEKRGDHSSSSSPAAAAAAPPLPVGVRKASISFAVDTQSEEENLEDLPRFTFANAQPLRVSKMK
jgi:hypothetical protein